MSKGDGSLETLHCAWCGEHMPDMLELLRLMEQSGPGVRIFTCRSCSDELDEKRFWRDVQEATVGEEGEGG